MKTIPLSNGSKKCSKCGIDKPLSEFHKSKDRVAGVVSQCKECKKEVSLAHREKTLIRIIKYRPRRREIAKKHYCANREKYIAKSREWYAENKERHHEQCRAWAMAHPEKRKEASQKYNQRVSSTPNGRLNNNMRVGMNESLQKGTKAGRHWETLVDFTIDQLKTHIEKLFKPGMTWENYGTAWHIDHKIPIAAFNFERPEDIDFRICWSLKNLQPLEASINRNL